MVLLVLDFFLFQFTGLAVEFGLYIFEYLFLVFVRAFGTSLLWFYAPFGELSGHFEVLFLPGFSIEHLSLVYYLGNDLLLFGLQVVEGVAEFNDCYYTILVSNGHESALHVLVALFLRVEVKFNACEGAV